MKTAAIYTGQRWKRSGPFSLAAGTGSENRLRLAEDYRSRGVCQAHLAAWRREAARLAREYLRTGREIHRIAFQEHVGGMLMRLRRDRAKAP